MEERDTIVQGDQLCNFYSENLAENSPQGILKHMIHEKLNTVENCVDIYMQFLPPGMASGKHRHLAEEVFFVAEGEGYDLHWDVNFSVDIKFSWDGRPRWLGAHSMYTGERSIPGCVRR